MDTDAGVPNQGADGGIERAAAEHILLVGAIRQHDVVDGEPADGNQLDHDEALRRSRSSSR